MLSAILNGKGPRFPEGPPSGASLRLAFSRSEDILTATVFERLAYLDGSLLWRILEKTFQPRILPRRNVVTLDSIEFWPTWGQARGMLGKAVEPDVVMRFSVGDPPVAVVLIIECKLGGFQYPRQWAEEWIAYHAEAGEDEQPGEVCLLALGGLANGPAATVAEFASRMGPAYGIEIKAAAAGWQDLRDALDDAEILNPIARRVAGDISAALDLHGFRRFRPLQDLSQLSASLGGIAQGHPALRWNEDEITTPDEPRSGCFSDFGVKTAVLRPIMEHRALRWSVSDV